mmetsp:Transcript_3840/g.11450  ORF Transcript_3840/g.11450 Transcript_3840/m.11450 type:complete len:761 (+) Transcript_3840:40-2322(+)
MAVGFVVNGFGRALTARRARVGGRGSKVTAGKRSVWRATLTETRKGTSVSPGDDEGSKQDAERPLASGPLGNASELKWEVQEGYAVRDEKTGLPLRYDGKVIREFWDKRPLELQRRWTYFLSVVVPFGTKLIRNITTGSVEKNQRQLARDFRIVLEKLGPTFVKFGQVLSIRPDIVGQDASDELAMLQDSVPVFPSDIARQVVEEELGRKIEEVFSEFSQEPVAAASLAQVYKGRLRDSGKEVAVKVQRPGLLPIVTKDLYVMRRGVEWAEPIRKRFSAEKTDYMELLNTWASGFYEELDFTNEAFNQIQFKELLAKSGLKNVMVPEVIMEYSTRRLLISEWVDGIKLTKASPEQIKDLIDIGNEAFLTQLLDWGVFHGDPHPGNLLVTPEGKLCILDFGLMASIPAEDRDLMVSAVIHLANKDFGQLVDDLIKLKFLPLDIDRPKVQMVMGKVLGPFVYQGGGANNVDFRSLARELSGVTREIPFSIPPYYALVGRAIISLEGIALTAFPNYRLVMEAYPYVARRVMTEGDTPELRRALAEILYKDGDFSVSRLAALLNSAMGYVGLSNDSIVDLDAIPEDGATLSRLVSYILSKDAKALRVLLADEGARAADIALRRAVLLRTNSMISTLARLPGPFRIGFNQVERANELSQISREEEIFLDSLIALFTQLLEVDVRGALDDPFKGLRTLPKLASNSEIQASARIVRDNQEIAQEFLRSITDKVRKLGTARFFDRYLPVAFPTLAPAIRRALPGVTKE